MTTNVYFSKGTPNEQHLYEDLAIEAIQIYGHDVFYIPRTLVNKDELFGESALSRFDDAYGIESVDGNPRGLRRGKRISF